MAPRLGTPKAPHAGRKKGVPNKFNQERMKRVQESGPTPLDVMITTMRYLAGLASQEQAKGEQSNKAAVQELLQRACAVAKDAAPYCHQRLAAIQHTGANGGPLQFELLDLSKLTDNELDTLERIFGPLAAAAEEPSPNHPVGSTRTH